MGKVFGFREFKGLLCRYLIKRFYITVIRNWKLLRSNCKYINKMMMWVCLGYKKGIK